MFDELIDEELAFVERPSRYAGCEVNADLREAERGEMKVCLAYPGPYEDGALQPALNALYAMLRGRAGFHVERAFAPAPDLAERLRRTGLSWFSLETRRPLAGFDLVVLMSPSAESVEAELTMLAEGGALKTKAVRWPAWLGDQEGRARAFFLGRSEDSLRGLRIGTDLLRPGSVPVVEAEPEGRGVEPSSYVVPFTRTAAVPRLSCPADGIGDLAEAVRRLIESTGFEKVAVRLEAPLPAWEPPAELERFLIEREAKVLFEDPDGAPLGSAPRGPRVAVEPRARLRFRLAREGRARWLSQLEQAQALRRALRRAGLPLATDAGRARRARLAYGPAVSVGQESESEYLDVWLGEAAVPETAGAALKAKLPAGFRLLESRKVPLHFPSVEAAVNASEWEALSEWPEDLNERIAAFDSKEEFWIEKSFGRTTSRIDLRRTASFQREGPRLRLRLRFPPGGPSPRPEEALTALGLTMAAAAEAGGDTAEEGTAEDTAGDTGSASTSGSTTGSKSGSTSVTSATSAANATSTAMSPVRLVRKALFTLTGAGETLSP